MIPSRSQPGRLVFAVVACLAAAPAGGASATIRAAIGSYEAGEFSGCRTALAHEAGNALITGEDRALALEYLAACSFELGDKEAARSALATLARERPDLRLNPATFVPELIALSDEARAAEAKAKPPPDEPRPAPVPQAQASTRVLIGVWALADVVGRSVGAGANLGVGFRQLDFQARLLAGERFGAGLEVGYALMTGDLAPRVGLRASTIPGVGIGGGPVVGGRFAIARGLTATLDVAGEAYSVPSDYHAFAVALTAGLSFDLASSWSAAQ